LIKQLSLRGESLLVTSIVLCEFCSVLHRSYRRPRTEIADAVEHLLSSDLIIAEHPDESRNAAILYREGPEGFADYLIGLIHQSAGCRDTVTFDRALRSAPGFTLLS
jgi:predicted nucleic-acid-binding protein